MPKIKGKQLEDNTVTATQTDTTNGTISTVNAGDSSVEGSGTGLSRRDHQHAVATGTPVDTGTSNSEGTSTDLARADHVHNLASHSHALADVTDVTASAAEVNVLDGFLGTTAELNEVTDGSDVAAATHHHDSTYVKKSTLTTKGDIFVRDTSAPTRLGVGTDGHVLTADSTQPTGIKWAAGGGGSSDIEYQEALTTENISTDSALTDTLNNTPKSNASVALFLNGVQQEQGSGKDYTISGTTITWLAGTGTAVDMETTDILIAVYVGS